MSSFHGTKITHCLSAALDAVDPAKAVEKYIVCKDDDLLIGEKVYNLKKLDRVIVIGIGKASIPMTATVIGLLGEHFTTGIAITKSIPSHFTNTHPKLEIKQAAHPIPDEQSLESFFDIGRRVCLIDFACSTY